MSQAVDDMLEGLTCMHCGEWFHDDLEGGVPRSCCYDEDDIKKADADYEFYRGQQWGDKPIKCGLFFKVMTTVLFPVFLVRAIFVGTPVYIWSEIRGQWSAYKTMMKQTHFYKGEQ